MKSKRALQYAAGCFLAVLTIVATGYGQADKTLESDKAFLASAFRSDFNEIKLSQLAADKSTNPDVKNLAQKIITDHTALEQRMKPFADHWGLVPASSLTAQQQALYDTLSGLSGKDFDKKYIQAMDEDHHLTETRFAAELQITRNKDFKTQVESARKVIDRDTSTADRLDRKLGMTPVGADITSI